MTHDDNTGLLFPIKLKITLYGLAGGITSFWDLYARTSQTWLSIGGTWVASWNADWFHRSGMRLSAFLKSSLPGDTQAVGPKFTETHWCLAKYREVLPLRWGSSLTHYDWVPCEISQDNIIYPCSGNKIEGLLLQIQGLYLCLLC